MASLYITMSCIEYLILLSGMRPIALIDNICNSVSSKEFKPVAQDDDELLTTVKYSNFDFKSDSTKLTYAFTKFILSSTLLVLYGVMFKIGLHKSASGSKSILIILVLIALS